MAFINISRSATPSLADRFPGFLADVKAMLARRAIYNQTVRELDALTNRELADLGIDRSEISALAREAAYGK